jgi:3-hydroxyisobutyrate dehydrogenase
MNVAWIGTGVMGASMAGHLQRAGHALTVYSRTKAKSEALLAAGAAWRGSPRAAAEGADAVCTMVGYPADVREVILGRRGALAAMTRGALLIDFTTSRPDLAAEIASRAAARGVDALDAPVSGGDVGAREGRLSIMVGGEPAAYERALPLLQAFGKTIVLQGPPGAGQHTKMVNQILIASTMMGVVEAVRYAAASGLDAERVLQSVGGGAAASWSLQNLAPRMLKRNFDPGFYAKHLLKDLDIAIREARRMKLDLPALRLAQRRYRALVNGGWGDRGTHALLLLYEAMAARNGAT